MSDELLTYVIIGAVIIGVLVTVIRLVLLGLGVSALSWTLAVTLHSKPHRSAVP